jgi:adenosylcobinamide kinase/adenosylcobinamide-phosphate guanylyltransferase
MPFPGGRLTVVLGGARSGKSSLVERLARESGRKVAFIATATPSDNDMRARIERHREDRPDWPTFEEPVELATALKRAAEVADVIIIDCMTLWLANWMEKSGLYEECAGDTGQKMETVKPSSSGERALEDIDQLLAALAELSSEKSLIVVTNEVGLGIVPMYQLSRIYRDTLGWVNQRLAKAADAAYFMVAGLAIDLKKTDREAALYKSDDAK